MIDLARFSANVRQLWEKTAPCKLCPRRCGVNRQAGQIGFCGIGALPRVSSAGPHFGEESVLVGTGGSGTIFFAGCNLGCVFCQNYDISHYQAGRCVTIEQLVAISWPSTAPAIRPTPIRGSIAARPAMKSPPFANTPNKKG